MRAAYYTATGAPEVIQHGELPAPTAGRHEVLVRVTAATVNPIDTYIRSGAAPAKLPMPFIPGCDLAGTIEQIGTGVTRFKVGDRVWGSNQGLMGRQGTFAQFAAVHEDWLNPIPTGVTEEQAAAGALVGITAHLGLFRCGNLSPGETVFVNGGTGGVGSMVVQMAKAAGARVITTVGSVEKVALCRDWGADGIIHYKSEDVPARIQALTDGKGIDVWYETLREPDLVRTVPLMARRGRIIVMAGRQAQPIFPVGPFYLKDLSMHGFAMFNASPEEQRRCADDMNRWYAAGQLRVPIGRRFPLSEAAAAHRLQEENTLNKAGTLTGKIVVTV
jgi:NADPH2:quinone reductase